MTDRNGYARQRAGSERLRHLSLRFETIICQARCRGSDRQDGPIRRVPSFLVLLPIVLLSVLPPSQCQEELPSGAGPTVTLGIEINLPSGGAWPVAAGADHAVFYIPAVGKGEMLGVIALPKGRFAGIRITPSMREDSVEIDVSALVSAKKKLSEAACNDIRSWQSVDAGSYEGKKDQSLSLSRLAQLGFPVFVVKVVRAYGAPPGAFHHPYAHFSAFCDCAATRDALNAWLGVLSFPDAGRCEEVGNCAQCCRISQR